MWPISTRANKPENDDPSKLSWQRMPPKSLVCCTVYEHDSSTFLDNQIRPTSPTISVDDARLILLCDRRKSFCTTSGPAVFTQERSKVRPCCAFPPSGTANLTDD
jgi:hypothetical protein